MDRKINLDKVIRHFPWDRLYQDLGYAMHYPEVLMTSDRAYALHTQVSALLMDLIYDGSLSYQIGEELVGEGQVPQPTLEVSLQNISEVWAYIGISSEKLESYMWDALWAYLEYLPEENT